MRKLVTVTISRSLLVLAFLSVSALAQPAKVYRIGMLDVTPQDANRANLNAFRQGMREAGYVEGRDFVLDYRSADGQQNRFAQLAAELARARPDVIVTRTTRAALAAMKAGPFPVVMATSADPIAYGVVRKLSRPGGNVTGLTTMIGEVAGKRLQLLKELAPQASRVAAPLNLANPTAAPERREIESAARSLGLEVIILDVRDAADLGRALDTALEKGANALLINAEAVLIANKQAIIEFAAKHRLPAVYASREYVDAGGLVAYGVDYPHLYYRAASYVGKILKGAKPGDLPIEKPTKLNLIINVRSATALGIAIPSQLVLRADELVQ
jgi:putative tryptophan/tyrosine transport system substrate-binding protein